MLINAHEGATFKLRLLRITLLNFEGSSSASSSSFCRSLMVSWGPSFWYMLLLRRKEGSTCSFSTPSFSLGLYCLLSIDVFRPKAEEVDAAELERARDTGDCAAVPSCACSFKKARNSLGAISGWRCAGSQKRWYGSSANVVPLSLLPESSSWLWIGEVLGSVRCDSPSLW